MEVDGTRVQFPAVAGRCHLRVLVVEELEGHLSFSLNEELESVERVGQREVAQGGAVAAGLRARRGFEEVRHGRLVAAEQGGVAAVHVVVPGAAGVVAHPFERGGQHEARADAAQVVRLRFVGRLHLHGTAGVDAVVVQHVAERTEVQHAEVRHAIGVDGGVGGNAACGDAVARGVAVGGRIVLYPAVVGVVRRVEHAAHERGFAEGPRTHLACVLVEEEGAAVVADEPVAVLVLHCREGCGIRFVRYGGEHGLGGLQGQLCLRNGVARFGPGRSLAEAHLQVEQVFLARFGLRSVGHGEGGGGTGLDGGHAGHAAFHFHTVGEHGVVELEGVQRSEVVGILDGHTLCGRVEVREADKLVNLLHLGQLGRPGAVGGHKAVVHEVALVRAGVVVARHVLLVALFGERAGGDVGRVVDGLVHEVPHATADAVGRLLDDVPILLQVAHGVTHGVGVFTHEEGLLLAVVVRLVLHPRNVGVHHAPEVRVGRVAACSAFVVDDAVGVERLAAVVGGEQVVARAALVAEAPEDHGGEVAVAEHHAFGAVEVGRLPRGAAGDGVASLLPVEVALHVGLVHAVEAVVVEHAVHLRLARVVAAAHGVHVGLLHELHVAQHGLGGEEAAVYGVSVLRVGPLEEGSLAVHVDQSVLDVDLAETVLRGEGHFLAAVGGELGDFHGVEVRRFGGPGEQAGEALKREGGLEERVALGKVEAGRLGGHLRAVGSEQLHAHVFLHGAARGVLHLEGHVHLAAVAGGVERRGDEVVAHEGLRCGVEVNIAVDAAHVPCVLALEVGTVAEAVHLYRHVVLAGAHKVRDVKFTVGIGPFGVAHILAVEPNVGCAVETVEVEHNALAARPAFGQGEVAAVRSHGVVEAVAHVDGGRRIVEGIVHVDVVGLAVAFHLQARGHGNRVPGSHIGRVGVEGFGTGCLRGSVHPVKVPDAVERHPFGARRVVPGLFVASLVGAEGLGRGVGHKDGVGSELVFAEDRLVLPEAGAGLLLRRGFLKDEVGGFGLALVGQFQPVVFHHVYGLRLVAAPVELEGVFQALDGFDLEALVGAARVGGPMHEVEGAGGLAGGHVDGEVGVARTLDDAAAVAEGCQLEGPFLARGGGVEVFGEDGGIVGSRSAVAEHLSGGDTPYIIGLGIAQCAGNDFLVGGFLKDEVGGFGLAVGGHAEQVVLHHAECLRLVAAPKDLVGVVPPFDGADEEALVGAPCVGIPVDGVELCAGLFGGHVDGKAGEVGAHNDVGAVAEGRGTQFPLLAAGFCVAVGCDDGHVACALSAVGHYFPRQRTDDVVGLAFFYLGPAREGREAEE